MRALAAIPRPAVQRSSPVERALYALAHAKAIRAPSDEMTAKLYPDDRVVAEIVQRGATTGMMLSPELAPNILGDFLATLTPMSAAAAIIGRGLQVSLAGGGSLTLPAREGAPGASTSWVDEGDPIPVRAYTLNADTVLEPKKFGFIVVITRELAKRANGEAVVRQLLREDAAATLDASYFNDDAGADGAHAGMLNGVSPLSGEEGGDLDALVADLIALTDAVTAAGSGQVEFIVSPKRVARLKILAPEIARELTIRPSLAVADTTVIAVDPLSWAHGFGDDFEIDAATDAVLHMSDDPDQISTAGSPPALAHPTRSLYQTDTLALRLIGEVAFAPRREDAVAWVEDVTW